MIGKPIHRRQLLRSTSAVVALPFLESLRLRPGIAAVAASARPKRMVFLGIGFGVTKETWYPDPQQTGSEWELPSGLQPLARHQRDLTIIQNLSNKFSNEAHWGSTFWLTGANRYAEPGQSFYNSISADQVAAEAFGEETRFTSLSLAAEDAANSGHGPGQSLSWNRQGKPVAGLNHPVAAYHRLFSDDKLPLAQRQAALMEQRSVLDTVLLDAKCVARGINRDDQRKLDEYFQSVRDIETRLSKEEQWLDKPKEQPADSLALPESELRGYEEIKLMYDLIVAALQVDATRVITYRQPLESLYRSLGVTHTAHNCSHYSPGPRMEASQLRDQKQSELLAHLIDRLKASREPDGTTLFDHTCLTLGSNIHSIHYLNNCPTLVTGGGANIRLGQHLVLADSKTPLCNLWLTLLRGVGLPIETHGDSTGLIEPLLV
jgi:hypothetical protein